MADPIPCPFKWRKTRETSSGVPGAMPKPRHGHRAVQIKELIIVFGGGNEGIIDELHVFNTTQNAWFVPVCKGEIAPGVASFGFAVENTRLLVHGGMLEYGKYSGDLWELQATKWEWKKLRPKPPRNGPAPCPRIGHSFTLVGKKIYLFGGLCNTAPDAKSHAARFMPFKYLNDLYVLDISKNPHQWEIPETTGTPPGPRESHTMVLWKKNEGTEAQKDFLILYGGMMGSRLGDIWMLDLESMAWQKLVISGVPPLPRSLHTAVVGNNKMFIFGGWIHRAHEQKQQNGITANSGSLTNQQMEWKCTNSLGVFDLEKSNWESFNFDGDENVPEARAGHCAAMVHNRMYVWSGRAGYKKASNAQVCCADMWFMETMKPAPPGKVQLLRAATNSLDVHWQTALTAESYQLQIQVYDSPPAVGQAASSAQAAAAKTATNGAAVVAGSKQATPGKNLPSGAQIVTLMKPGVGIATQNPTASPGKPPSVLPIPAQKTPKQPHMLVVPAGSLPGLTAAKILPTTVTDAKDSPSPAEVKLEPDSKSEQVTEDESVKEPVPAAKEDSSVAMAGEKTSAESSPNTEELASIPTDAGNKEKITETPAPITLGSSAGSSQESGKEKPKETEQQVTKIWYTVGEFTEGNASVSCYMVPVPFEDDAKPDSKPEMMKVLLQPGTAYKFRVAGINLCGRGSYSEMSAFKTCLPGFPGAPSNIKITKCPEGALLTWEPPTNHGDNISEYAVYLATKPSNSKPELPIPTNQLSFVKVYDNPTPTCIITTESLRHAYYDLNGLKPAIIFRIAAKNEKGYGPATQVRWLQDAPPGQLR